MGCRGDGRLEDVRAHVPVTSKFTVPVFSIEDVILGVGVRIIVEVKPPVYVRVCVCKQVCACSKNISKYSPLI